MVHKIRTMQNNNTWLMDTYICNNTIKSAQNGKHKFMIFATS